MRDMPESAWSAKVIQTERMRRAWVTSFFVRAFRNVIQPLTHFQRSQECVVRMDRGRAEHYSQRQSKMSRNATAPKQSIHGDYTLTGLHSALAVDKG